MMYPAFEASQRQIEEQNSKNNGGGTRMKIAVSRNTSLKTMNSSTASHSKVASMNKAGWL